MYSTVHLLVLGSLVLGSEVLSNILYFIYFFYISIFFQFQVSMIFKEQIE